MPTLTDYLPDPFGKDIFRLQAKRLREEAHQRHPYAARQAAAQFMTNVPVDPKKCVSVYYPAGSELHTWPLVEELQRDGITVCLPVVTDQKRPLIFRQYDSETVLEKGAYGIMVPSDKSPVCHPDIVVVPLLGFKKSGARLGMGGGYYDRTLSILRRDRQVKAVGYAYAAQEIDGFPVERHDQPLNWIVTEREAIKVR